jgi:hypothetical protein
LSIGHRGGGGGIRCITKKLEKKPTLHLESDHHFSKTLFRVLEKCDE